MFSVCLRSHILKFNRFLKQKQNNFKSKIYYVLGLITACVKQRKILNLFWLLQKIENEIYLIEDLSYIWKKEEFLVGRLNIYSL